jgi:hypothetical protein
MQMKQYEYIRQWKSAHADNIAVLDDFIMSVNESIPKFYPLTFIRAGFEEGNFPNLNKTAQPDQAEMSFAGRQVAVEVRTVSVDASKASFLGRFEFTLEAEATPFYVAEFNSDGEWHEPTIDGKISARHFRTHQVFVDADTCRAFGDCLIAAIHLLITKRLAMPSKGL